MRREQISKGRFSVPFLIGFSHLDSPGKSRADKPVKTGYGFMRRREPAVYGWPICSVGKPAKAGCGVADTTQIISTDCS
jgi:hypothetical protein